MARKAVKLRPWLKARRYVHTDRGRCPTPACAACLLPTCPATTVQRNPPGLLAPHALWPYWMDLGPSRASRASRRSLFLLLT